MTRTEWLHDCPYIGRGGHGRERERHSSNWFRCVWCSGDGSVRKDIIWSTETLIDPFPPLFGHMIGRTCEILRLP